MKRPALWFTLSFATGILLQKQTGSFLISFLCCVAMAGLFNMGKMKGTPFIFVILMGALWLMLRDPLASPELHGKRFEGEGEIIQVLSYKEERTRAVLRSSSLNGENYRGKFYFVTDEKVEPGDWIRFHGDFYLPEGRRNPFGFEQDSYLKSLGVKGSLYGDEVIMLSEKGWRSYGVQGIQRSYGKLKPVTADFLSRVVLGYGETEEEGLRQLGLSHVLAASGLHLGVLSAFFIFFFQLIGLSKNFASYFTLALLWLYGALIGFPISLVRSLIMFSLLILALPLQKAYDNITAWAVAAGISLIYNPWWLFRTGFLLSYGATGSLLILYPEIKARFLSKYPSLAVYFAVQLGIFPLQMSFFNQWNPWSLAANLLFLPFFMVAFILSFLLLPFGQVSIVGDVIAFVVDLGMEVFLSLTDWASGLPGIIRGASWDFSMILFYFALLGTFFYLSREKIMLEKNYRRWALVSWCFLFVYSSLSVLFPPMTVRYLDMGQGDATLIFGQHHLMIDTGGEGYGYDTGEGILFPTLEKLGMNKIHGLYLTHLDADHCENAMELVKQFTVERVYLPPQESNPWFKEFLETCRQQGTEVNPLKSGENHRWGSISLTNYYLPLEGNDGSLVQELEKGRHRFLFTGDVGFEAERRLLEELSPAQVLKVGHHGSKDSTGKEFLHRIGPKYGILSVGERNSYGHPHEDVLARLEEAKVTVYRTDWQGCITWEETFRGKIYGQNEAGREALKLWIAPLLYIALAIKRGKGKEDENRLQRNSKTTG